MVLVGQRRAGLFTVAYISACIVCAPLISRDDTDLASVITGLMHGDPVFSHTTVTVFAVCFLKALSCPRCLLDLFRPRPEQRSRPVRHAPAVLCALCAPLAHSSPHGVTLYPRPRAKGDTSFLPHLEKKTNQHQGPSRACSEFSGSSSCTAGHPTSPSSKGTESRSWARF